jgi:hypothetical protein
MTSPTYPKPGEAGYDPTYYFHNPRVCKECGQDLFPNYMEGSWEHFAPGCKFTGFQQPATPPGKERMLPYKGFKDFAGDFKYPLSA